jgi:hypothetical protein
MTATANLTCSPAASATGAEPARQVHDHQARRNYLTILSCLFAFFSTMRVLAYLPTLWAIVQSGDSSQHSLLTWITWTGANLTMAAWLYEQEGQRCGRAVAVSLVNATMCVATFVAIWALRP